MGDSAAYIHMVHHLIEECLIFKMSKAECMEALSKHGKIVPVITSTVWNELEKENKEFFKGYSNTRKENTKGLDSDAKQKIHQIVAHYSQGDSKQ